MKKNLSVLIAILFSVQLLSQAPDIIVDWGPILKTKDVDFDFIIGSTNEHFYTYGEESRSGLKLFSKPELNVSLFSKETFRPRYKKVLEDFEYKGENANFLKAYVKPNGEAVLYFDVYHTKNDRRYLISRTIDERGRFGQVEELSSVVAEKSSESNFEIRTSKDSTKLLVYANPPYERKENEKFHIQVFTRDHELLWEKKVILPYTDKYFNLIGRSITNDGDVFVLGYATPDKYKGEKKDRDKSNESYKLYRISQEEDDIIEFDLGFDNRFISNSTINSDFGDGQMAIAGFYTDDRKSGKKSGIEGSFFYTINQETLEPVSTSFEKFSTDFMKNFMSDRRAEKDRDLFNFKFRNLIRRKDGGAVMIAEQSYVQQHTTRSANGVTTTYYSYHNYDIIVVNVNPDGSISWSAHVPKEQRTTNDGGMYNSYLLVVENDKLHFIYNDHKKNAERLEEGRDLKTMGNPRKAIAVVSTVEAGGKVYYDQLFRNKDFNAILVPRRSHQVNDRNILIFGEKGRKCRFGKIVFQ